MGTTYLAGIDVGGTKTAVILGARDDADGCRPPRILGRQEFPTADQAAAAVIARSIQLIRVLGEAHGVAAGSLASVGISCGGPLDSARGIVLSPPNLPGWDRVPIVRKVEDALGCPARLRNDANACALAEWRYGAGRGVESMVFLTFGTGLGAGLILGGQLYEGAGGLAGEVGHIRLSDDGPEGYGKRGSFEGWCSGGGIARLAARMVGERLMRGEDVAFCPSIERSESLTAQDVCIAAAGGDETAREILATSGSRLGEGLSILIDVLNPERIVIGGVFARCSAYLLPAAAEVMDREALPPARRGCRVVAAELGEKIGDYGALSVAEE